MSGYSFGFAIPEMEKVVESTIGERVDKLFGWARYGNISSSEALSLTNPKTIIHEYKNQLTKLSNQVAPLRLMTKNNMGISISTINLFAENIFPYWQVLEHHKKWFWIRLLAESLKSVLESDVNMAMILHAPVAPFVASIELGKLIKEGFENFKTGVEIRDEINEDIEQFIELYRKLFQVIVEDAFVLATMISEDILEASFINEVDDDRTSRYDHYFAVRYFRFESDSFATEIS